MSYILGALVGLASGMAISGAVFALIASVGVVSSMAQRTRTQRYSRVYELAIIWGGIFGSATLAFNIRFPVSDLLVSVLSLAIGVFFGVFVMSLAEELDVLPVTSKRLGVRKGVSWLILAIALGKMAGSLLYFLVSGFFTQGG
ncbi:MAG: stage V sporulation protein AB [Clostridiales bacterium]|jgi:stage V sporulation protein AB|nr:stage V sporulation protein AB [Clostridiales bacterium]